MSRSTKKGPFVDKKLLARIVEMNKKREKKGYQDLVQGFHYIS